MPRLAILPVLLALGAAVLLAGGCRQGKPQPVEIVLSEDACSECRMAVSDRKFAAELVTTAGHVDYFDDIGCLIIFLRKNPPPSGSAAYVVDFYTGSWLEQTQAYFLHAKTLPTPMSYGLAAFVSEIDAQKAAKQWPGKVLGWSDLLREFRP